MQIKFKERWRAYEAGIVYEVGSGIGQIHVAMKRAIEVKPNEQAKLERPPSGRKKPTAKGRKGSKRSGSSDRVRKRRASPKSSGGDGSADDTGISTGGS